MRRLVVGIALVLLAGLMVAACDDGGQGSQGAEGKRRQDSYDRLVREQPAETMGYSPTRENINFWINTWDEPGKLSFVYLMASNGQFIGYYVLQGLPVSYCAALTPTYEGYDHENDDNDTEDETVPAPSVDGVYYSGGQCNQYYGRDATTGAYVEFSIGNGINYLLFDQPLPRQDIQPLGVTTVEAVS